MTTLASNGMGRRGAGSPIRRTLPIVPANLLRFEFPSLPLPGVAVALKETQVDPGPDPVSVPGRVEACLPDGEGEARPGRLLGSPGCPDSRSATSATLGPHW